MDIVYAHELERAMNMYGTETLRFITHKLTRTRIYANIYCRRWQTDLYLSIKLKSPLLGPQYYTHYHLLHKQTYINIHQSLIGFDFREIKN